MRRYRRRARLFAAVLSAVAGYVDAIAFLMTGGFFASFMSGNSTRVGVGLANHSREAALAASLIALFVLGAAAGALAGRAARSQRAAAVLALVTVGVALSAALAGGQMGFAAVLPLAFGMGAENAVFAEDGEVRIGLTYMTGSLVKLGKGLAEAASGGDRWAWAPYLGLWLGLVLGATAGAFTFGRLGAQGLWLAAGTIGALALAALQLQPLLQARETEA